MTTFAQFVYLLALVMWIGAIIFFSFFTAPVVFKQLERKQAGELIGAIFPRYYKLQYVCGGLMLISLATLQGGALNPNWLFLAIMIGCALYAGQVVNPEARKLKEQIAEAGGNDEALEARFKSLHSMSVKLNSAVLVMGLGMLWITALHLKL